MSGDFISEPVFHGKEFDEARALAFGFKRAARGFVYSRDLADGRFRLETVVTPQGDVFCELSDARMHTPYVLHRVEKASGSFVGRIREEYKQALEQIAAQCFKKSVYKSVQAKELIAYINKKYGDEPEFLWKAFPAYCVLRRRDTAKWYAVFMTVPCRALNLPGEEKTEIVVLRAKLPSSSAANGVNVFPGYHMNKKTWFTVLLDGSVPWLTLQSWLEASYALACGNKKTA